MKNLGYSQNFLVNKKLVERLISKSNIDVTDYVIEIGPGKRYISKVRREPDGSYNEDYCKWCYANGKFAYQSKESLLDYLVANMPNPDNADEETRRNQFDLYLSQLKHWK